MNKGCFLGIFLMISVFSFSAFTAENQEDSSDVHLLEVNYFLENKRLLELDNQSLWELKTFKKKRSKTVWEWWKKVEPAEWSLDESYFFDIKNWKKDAVIQVSKVNKTLYPDFEYVLTHLETQEKVLAKPIPYASQPIPKIEYLLPMLEFPYKAPMCIWRNVFQVNNIILLEDGTFWKLSQFHPNVRSLTEWWYGVQIEQPDPCFVFYLSNWKISDVVQLYRYETETSKEVYAIENLTRGNFAYVTPISLDVLCDLYNSYALELYDDGYDDGYTTAM
jgi:hypothetical protein